MTASLEALDSQIARLQSALLPYGDGERVGPGHEPSGMSDALAELTASVEDVRRGSRAGRRAAREAVWSAIYHDTIAESEWFTEKAVSPGRWAVGYPFLYVLYRVLDEMRPTTILELGLGQSTKVAAQYSQGTDGIAHTVVEHDPEWITSFAANFALPSTTRVRRLDLTTVEQDEGEPVLRYDGFADAVSDARYDLIVVDGPFGGGAERARIDVLDLIPHSLAERFVVMLDDYNRPGERRTAESILEALDAAGIAYETTTYEGEKSLWVVTSPDLKFFTSL
ncbi:class I SAM-dependent methyltransferase [Demequina muriae]|uniref:Class I SAM-dependent methyltransferase n=1 Tax=Demequina muriae TaxID=3051664 RepID=A0ABT8GG87_9MICO|nr:class I SAM-dependent methyltransferase [Demequina sp. EGI L300058]MDN4480427.1 class I SAM-dependent methyltransferase [Demequina sp. EGI L300058]